ncbi:MAG: 2-oxoisovalerate dehydrogenase subunit beta [Myxococcota bacterium]|nr:2-oxoisovalerate dehydrogenase subunit beta [Myxococcota bacterium]
MARELTYIDGIRRAMDEEMVRDPSVFLMGQDIAEFGGPFKATAGLVEKYGAARVINTPISESGTVGMGAGAALLGGRPVIEMQFADFITCGFNQVVNVAAKMYFRWQAPIPMVIRLPCGGGTGAGPFHSQENEAWFMNTPGLKVVVPAFADDAYGLLKSAIRDPNPVMYFEHKFLYRRMKAVIDGEFVTPIGKARIARPGDAVSILTYGWMTIESLEAAALLEKQGVNAEVVDLRSLVPLDMETIAASVKKTGRALIVHEATLTAGPGAEIAARVADECFAWLDAPVRRLAYPDVPVPFHKKLELSLLPNRESIARAAGSLLAY